MHGWIRECGKKENKQKDLKYICVCCVKIWSELNKKWVDAQEIWDAGINKRKWEERK